MILKQAPNGFGFLFSIEHSETAKLCFFSFLCVFLKLGHLQRVDPKSDPQNAIIVQTIDVQKPYF